MNPRHLTPALMEEYRKCIFGAMYGTKVVEYGMSPWMAYNPVKRIQDPLPALANAVSRSIKNKRRGTRILDFDVFKKTSERLRKGRAEEKEQRRDARVLKLVVDAIAQRKMDESAKIRTQNIEVADEAVDILMLGGLGEHMKVRKGKNRDKHIKEFLDENLRAPSSGNGDAEPSEALDDSEKDEDTSSQEKIAKLKFEPGLSGKDPPEGVKNRSYALFTKHNAPRGVITFEHEYNFFKGMKADNTIMDILQLNPVWCENVFELVFTQLCRLHPGNWFHVPIGSAHRVPGVVASPPFTSVAVCYQQKDRDYCLPYSVASCLIYMGHVDEARQVAAAAPDFVSLPGDVAFEKLRAIMIEVLPQMGHCMVWNV
jgi:hypothetical protein